MAPEKRSSPASGMRRRSPSHRGRLVRRGRRRAPADPLDRLDVAILAAFQADGRASFRRVARKVGASVTTVCNRVRTLERSGILQGFVPLVSVQRLAALGRSPHCVVLHVAPGDRSPRKVEEIAQSIAREPSVCYLFQMAGSSELMALASLGSAPEIDRLIHTIATIPGVDHVRPISIMQVYKERPGHPVGATTLDLPLSEVVGRR